jgi:hypothetical protein
VAIARQRCGRDVSTATNEHAKEEKSLHTMSSTKSVLKLYEEGKWKSQFGKYKRLKLGGGQAYDRSNV